MSANVESMFYVRETPWHGLGTKVMTAPDSKEALIALSCCPLPRGVVAFRTANGTGGLFVRTSLPDDCHQCIWHGGG